MTWDVSVLFVVETAASLLNTALELCESVGLPVTTWRAGDPTHTLLRYTTEEIATRDEMASSLAKSAWLSTATGAWLTLLARDVFGIERTEATYSTPTVTLANNGGGRYVREAGEVIVKCSATGVTFRSTEALLLETGPGTTATIALVADVAGSDGTVATDDIDEIVTTMLEVTCDSSTAAVGIDEQSDPSLVDECTASLGALSANGPPDAYVAVALNEKLTGTLLVTRATSSEDSATGDVTLWIAGASGALDAGVVTLVQAAVEAWATPCCVTPTVASASNAAQNVVATVSGEDIPVGFASAIAGLYAAHFATVAIGGYVSSSALVAIAQTYLVGEGATDVLVAVSSPTSATLTAGNVATLGTSSITEI